ncbi:hypothetical protein LVJ94_29585 [Pendulispora rubella]|uniref:Uncharacterized protein n=1 Tax=Pendulispora rubella TaxID=2741070 RepID=A0ABZ2KSN2_9BACT
MPRRSDNLISADTISAVLLAQAPESTENVLSSDERPSEPRRPTFSTRQTHVGSRSVPNRFSNQTVWRKASRPSVRGK